MEPQRYDTGTGAVLTVQGFRLSPQQEHFCRLHTRADIGAVAQGRVEIAGDLDAAALRRALERVVERHEILRTTYQWLPGLTLPVQVVEEASPGFLWAEREGALERIAEADRATLFDLTRGPLLRATLVQADAGRRILLLTLPALSADTVSLYRLADEIALAYAQGAAGDEREAPLQYADAAEILHEWLETSAVRVDLAGWAPLCRPAIAGGATSILTLRRELGPEETAAVAHAAERLGTPVPLLLLAAWNATLWHTTGEGEIVAGLELDGRTCAEMEEALGLFARCLPLRCGLGPGSTLRSLVAGLAPQVAELMETQDGFPLDAVEDLLAAGGGAPVWPFGFACHRPSGSALFTFLGSHAGIDRCELRLVAVDAVPLRFELQVDSGRIGNAEAERLLARFVRVLAGLAAAPDLPLAELDVLSEAERRELLKDFNATAAPFPADRGIQDLFAEQARLTPQATAVTAGDLRITYAELDARANGLARHLRGLGVAPESLVGLCCERSPEMVVGLLGTLKAGGAYVPLDPGYPAERLSFLLEDSGVSVLLTQERLLPRLPTGGPRIVCLDRDVPQPAGELPAMALPESPAYVIYTSGSTGRPKGVVVPHRGLVNYVAWARQAYDVRGGNGAPVHSPVGFDLTVTSLLVPLAAGAAVDLLPDEPSVTALGAALRARPGYSLVKITPAHLEVLRQVLAPAEAAGAARALVIGGEALRAESLDLWRHHAPATRLINEYGPTETVVGCCVYEVRPEDPASGPVPIGRPIANARLYVAGPGLRPVVAGVPGELWIGGAGVARGYHGRPDLTAERFVPDPFGHEPGARLYRTGDLVRLRADGELEFLGRLDEQVKVRGFRIEPGEVEAALAAHPGVREAVVVARSDGSDRSDRSVRLQDDLRLVAYVVPADAARPEAAGLRAFLGTRLPEHMIPAAFVPLDALPLTAHGKVDRSALPEPPAHPEGEVPYAAPRTVEEELLAEILGAVLGVERVGIDDDFFGLGGDSIRSVQVLSLAQERGLTLSLQELFRHRTIRGLSPFLGAGEAGPALSGEPFARVTAADRARMSAGIAGVVDAYPLARLQAGMLFHSDLDPESAVYHDLHSYHLRGSYDRTLLQAAVDQAVRRHPALRTSFDLRSFAEPLQLVHERATLPVGEDDLRHLAPEERERAVAGWLAAERHRPFDPARAPLTRVHVHLRGEETFQLTLSFHHSILDGWSAAVLLTELFRRYAALRASAPLDETPPEAAFRDAVLLERQALESGEAAAFWRRHLAGSEVALLPRRGTPGGEEGARLLALPPPAEVSDRLRRLARTAAVPLKSVLLAVHFRVLGLLAGRTDVVAGVVGHGRPERSDGDQVLGLFLNTLPLRLRLPGGTWTGLAQAAFEIEREALPFRRFPLAEMQRLEGGRPLFEALFNFMHYHVYRSVIGIEGIQVLERSGYEETNFPLTAHFHLDPGTSRVILALNYRAAELGDEEAEAIGRRYLAALSALAADPEARYEEVLLLSEAELLQVLVEWNGRAGSPAALPPIHLLVEQQAARDPEACAVVEEGRRSTYGEIDAQANRLAHRLRAEGVGPEVPVAVLLERSAGMVVALLAILKAGGAYVPLDPAYPPERLAFVLADTGAPVLLTTGELAASLAETPSRVIRLDAEAGRIAAQSAEALPAHVLPESLAYVIYTSGSTGRPKGVQITHANVARLLSATAEWFRFGPDDAWTLFHSYAFDFSVWEIWGALAHGGRLVIVPYWVSRSPGDFHRLLVEEGVTVLNQTPSAFRQLASWEEENAPAAGGLALREVIFGGEALDAASLRPWLARHGDERPRLVNMYGITETTVHVTYRPLSAADAEAPRSPLGVPIPDLRLYLLDAYGNPAPVGVPGELHVGGGGLARGYLGRPELTAERFVPDRFSGPAGARLYRSGDLARRLPGGELEFLGRVDQQVKVRGFRIELGEIEAALARHPAVREAVVLAGGPPDDLRLTAYVVAQEGAAELRGFLRDWLPEHMVPVAFVILDRLPLTPSGKVDRRSLPVPDGGPNETSNVAPRSAVEEMVAGLFAEVLGRERLGAGDDFFALGGHSLLAVRAISRVRAVFGVEVPLRALFEAPTVTGFAAEVERAWRTGQGAAAAPLGPRPRDEEPPLSFAQQRLWFLDQLEPGSPAYNIPVAVRLLGPLALPALERSLGEIVARHEALRTTFPLAGDRPAQRIAAAAGWSLPLVDLAAVPADLREPEMRHLAAAEERRPFDLACGPLLRKTLVRLDGEEHVLLLTMHHIVTDGWSLGVLIREMGALYPAFAAGRPSPLPPLALQYADFAVWQRAWMDGEALAAQLRYWRERLAGAPEALDLPADRPRPAVPSGRGGATSLSLSTALSADLAALGRREGVTLFMTLLAAFGVLLQRTTGRDDLVVGTDTAGRDRAETEGLIGFFVNQLALRCDLSGDPEFLALLARTREVALGAYAHQDVPFERLVDELQLARDLSRQPLFQVAFNLQNQPAAPVELPRLTLVPLSPAGGAARLDLAVTASETPAGLRLTAEYSTDLFDGPTIARLLRCFAALLEAAAEQPGLRLAELPLLAEAERHQIAREWNDSAAVFPGGEAGFLALFERRAAAHPGAVAAICEGERITYGELAARADRLARRLAAEGVGPESVVALVADRGLGFLTAVLAAFKAGTAYLPIDPLHPLQRQMELLAGSGARVVLASRLFAPGLERPLAAAGGPRLLGLEDLLDGEDATNVHLPPGSSESLAYVIYTSGSTGTPKGAMVEQRGMLNHLWAKIDALGLSEGDTVAQTASQCFDISVWQLLAALLVGGRVHIFPDEVAHDPLRLLHEAERGGITVLETVPSLLRLMLDEIAARREAAPPLPCLRWLIPTGEALPPDLGRRWLALYPHIPLVNAYGPTECSDDVTHWIVRTASDDRQARIPIGRPVPNLRLYTLGQAMQALPAGVPGELYAGGAGVGRGYLGDGGRTAAAWVPDPFAETPGERLYRTGDLARRLADGRIDLLGRIDHQVKVRGHRIELGEIEATLAAHPAVRQAAVLAREEAPGNHRLMAYVVAEPRPTTAELRRALAERLPDVMVPAAFVFLDAFPLTPNGKLDRKALPAPDHARPELDKSYSAPQTPAEETLARIWAQILRLDRIGVHDNFFELGGDSILSIQVVTRAGEAGLRLTPRQMFQHQTIAELASVAGTVQEADAEQGVVTGEAPLSPIQRWFFDQGFAEPGHWNQALLLETLPRLDPAVLAAALGALLAHHDALRLRFRRGENGWRQVFPAPAGEPPLTVVDLGALPADRRSPEVAVLADLLHEGFDLEQGPIVRAALYDLGAIPGRLHLVVHHLAVDGVSWQILLEDLQAACRALAEGKAPALPAKTLSFKGWAERLAAHARSGDMAAERDLWPAPGRARTGRLPVDHPGGANLNSSAGLVTAALEAGETTALLQEVPRAYHTQINDALLTALARTLAGWTGERRVLVELEGHGREDLFEGVGLGRTVGWFTSQFPLLLEVSRVGDPGEDLKAVKETLRAIPHGGVGWGLLRYLGDAETADRLAALPVPETLFNYQGQLDAALPAGSLFGPAPEPSGLAQSRRERRTHLLEVNGWVAGGRLQLSWAFSRGLHRRSTIEELAGRYLAELRVLIEHCRAPEAGGYTPSDFAAARMSQGDLDKLLGRLGKGSRT